jgi:hypothetical protein
MAGVMDAPFRDGAQAVILSAAKDLGTANTVRDPEILRSSKLPQDDHTRANGPLKSV